MSLDQIRRCPTCGQENAPDVLRCACGALLVGVDLTTPTAAPTSELAPESASTVAIKPDGPICPHTDCAQPNPPGSTRCVYCDRPLDTGDDGLSGATPGTPSLITLPAALRSRYRIARPLPATGAEAELLIVHADDGGPELVAKIYRHGIHPKREVQERLAGIDPAHRVEVLEHGLSDGFAYELMEYCSAGSLRDLLRSGGPLPAGKLREVIDELAAAIAAVHQAGLIHRDLKPENMLIRQIAPLDLVLTDFGIASLHNATLRFTGVARTLAYGAPETLSGVIDGQADWWSLGMTLLEAAQGRHPFAGLSEAVILHQLTTRPIDLAGIADPALKKLLRGLLQRDPAKRWGHAEVRRWLAGDPTLAAPADENRPVFAGRPYQIGDDLCATPEQLAVGLARHWSAAVADLDNGLLMNWFRHELQDQNRVRFLIELNFESKQHADLRLLRLLINLAPGIPPVWRGEPLALRDILRRADAALKNDADAALWLNTLYEFRVLEAYAAGGNAQCADIVKRWQNGLDAFNAAWQRLLDQLQQAEAATGQVKRFDDVMYGDSKPLRPSPRQLHARLLALAYDEGWAARLRDYLGKEILRLVGHCPWLPDPASLAAHSAIDLLAIEMLLPEARKQAKRAVDREKMAAEEAQETTRRLRGEAPQVIAQLQQAADQGVFIAGIDDELGTAIERFRALAAAVRAHGQSSADYQALRQQMVALEPVVYRMARARERLLERREENFGWFSQPTLIFAAIALLLVPLLLGQWLLYPMLLGAFGFVVWRLLPNFKRRREIATLGRLLTPR